MNIIVPVPAKAAVTGEQIYNKNCSVCHGDRGDGSSWARNGLNPPPRNFTSEEAKQELSRQRMLHSVTDGRPGTAMMPFKTKLNADEIGLVVGYIRAHFMGLEQEPAAGQTQPAVPAAAIEQAFPGGLTGDAAKGKDFYQGNCYVCHGRQGDGRGPRATFITPPPRNFLSPQAAATYDRPALYKAISTGKAGTVMPAWSAVLSPQQIADVAEYVFQAFIREKKKP